MLALLGAALPACTGLEPAAVSAGASAAESGVSIFTQGKVQKFEPAPYERVLAAMRESAAVLDLRLTEEDSAGHRSRLVFRDELNASIVVVVQLRTSTITWVQGDVGTLGRTALASLLLTEVGNRLRAGGAYVTTPEH